MVGWKRGMLELPCTRPKPHEREAHPRGVKPTGKTSARWKCQFPDRRARIRGPVTGMLPTLWYSPVVLLRRTGSPFLVGPLPGATPPAPVLWRAGARIRRVLQNASERRSEVFCPHIRGQPLSQGGRIPVLRAVDRSERRSTGEQSGNLSPNASYWARRASFAAARRSISSTH